jgi:uncharacterized phage protein gp47/JayE
MPSPDVSQYVDLTLYDVDAQALVDRALTEAAVRFPDWTPREGNTEVVLIEAMALQVAELVYAINRVPGAVTEVLLRLFGLNRAPGSPPTATARIYVANSTGYTVPSGTRLRLPQAGQEPLDFLTVTDLTVAPGATSGVVDVIGEVATTEGAGALAGAALSVVTPILFVERAELASNVVAGYAPEDSRAFLDRGAARLQRLVTTLVLPEHFTAAAAENPYVARATTVDNYDPGQSGIPGDHLGHVTVAVAGPGGTALTAPQKADLDLTLESQSMAAISVHVIDATVTTVNVTVTVVRQAGYLDADVQANVTAAIRAYLSPEVWGFNSKVYWAEMISVIDHAVGVQRVSALATPSGDLTLSGVAPLATAGTIAVTVVAP